MIEQSELDTHLKTIADAGYEINPPNLARLQGWNEILLQIVMAKFFLATLKANPEELGDLEHSFTKGAYFLAFLTTYGKCFTGAGGHRISLDEKDVFKGEPDVIAQGHSRIMELRHTFAAHNSESGLVVSTMAAKDEGDVVRVIHLVTQAIPLGELPAFEDVLLSLEHYVEVRLNSRLDKIEVQIGKRILLE
jgi:hypothetical protein